MKRILLLLTSIILSYTAHSQFYNGTQMSYGKNKVQYKEFNWRYFSYDNFDVYFYERGENNAKYAADIIQSAMKEYSSRFSVYLRKRIEFVVYNKLSDYKQTNLDLQTSETVFSEQGNLKHKNNLIFLYFGENHEEFATEIRQIIAELYINEILSGKAFFQRLANSALINAPAWFDKGLASYIAKPYNINVLDKVRDVIETKKRLNFNYLSSEEAIIMGHSFWYFLEKEYGKDAISNILYFVVVNKSLKKTFNFVLGKNLKELIKDWRVFYSIEFSKYPKNIPDYSAQFIKTQKKRVYHNLIISPNDKYIAYVENNQGKYRVFLYNKETQKRIKIHKEGDKYDEIIDFTYPYLSWSKNGKILAFTTEYESQVNLWTYNIEKEELKSKIIPNISKVQSFSFSPNGHYIVFSALINGYTDLFVFNMLSSTMHRVTFDLADDIDPVFNNQSNKIIFASNRSTDSLKRMLHYEDNSSLNNTFDLYSVNYPTNSAKITRLTNTPFSNETKPENIFGSNYLLLSDSSGIRNRYTLNFDSTINFIDTTVHYKYVTNIKQNSDYSQNLISYNLGKNSIGEVIYDKNKYRLSETATSQSELTQTQVNQSPTFFRKQYVKSQKQEQQKQTTNQANYAIRQSQIDSLMPLYKAKLNTPNNTLIDINNYIFEIERDSIVKICSSAGKSNTEENSSAGTPQMRVYHPTFYINNFDTRIDFDMLNQSYQAFNGGPFIFNSGMDLFTTIEIDELFNNYKLLAGFKWGFGNFMEYIFSIENLKKRLDKQLVFYRQSIKNNHSISQYEPVYSKTKTNQLMFILKYPFNRTTAIKGTILCKYDREITLSTDYDNLVKSDKYNFYTGAKLEYIFDNTKEISPNIKLGTKYKFFGEFYQQMKGKYYNTFTLGVDFRTYKKIFRNFIYAGRIAAGTSFGSGKIIYYLGGVDNWYTFSFSQSQKNLLFDTTININYEENYLFQAVATNMRGFKQNIRNGTNFVVMNHELRLPVFQMFSNSLTGSSFFYNFQIIGFFDIGSAWNGWSPYDKRNKYNTLTIKKTPFTVIVDLNRPPYVYSYGFGFRTKLLGYFIRFDWGWGREADYNYGRKLQFSIGFDF